MCVPQQTIPFENNMHFVHHSRHHHYKLTILEKTLHGIESEISYASQIDVALSSQTCVALARDDDFLSFLDIWVVEARCTTLICALVIILSKTLGGFNFFSYGDGTLCIQWIEILSHLPTANCNHSMSN